MGIVELLIALNLGTLLVSALLAMGVLVGSIDKTHPSHTETMPTQQTQQVEPDPPREIR